MSELLGWAVEAHLAARPGRVVVRARRGQASPVVLKATVPGASWGDRAGLRQEGRLLDRLRGPGVVDLLDVVDAQRRTALVLRFLPTDLDAHPDVDLHPLRAALDRLGQAGIVHGALRPEHVLLTAEGDTVLCGFGSAHRSPVDTTDARDLDRLLRRPDGGDRPRSRGGRRGGRRRP